VNSLQKYNTYYDVIHLYLLLHKIAVGCCILKIQERAKSRKKEDSRGVEKLFLK